jgi:nucleotide-binding universal stress UspA family protein
MYKRILVAVDGSDTSNLALKEAITLAKGQQSTLRLFHVIDLTMTYSSVQAPHVAEYRDALQAEGQKVIADASGPVRMAGIHLIQNASRHSTSTFTTRLRKRQSDGQPISSLSGPMGAGESGASSWGA